ncbi:gluconate 2-dehydrogenase subunit 3 family protein [Spongiivirga citrea]|uniref:Gluconate 2-dehydrogenase subunit 3 family protein n=1 Tax=Spongiivirga citrea TaxID=1481457 RepID=A0A6M0CI30_9FLAO|nr:gluconate 2-dehydrogenase subunit 3 family protein [Spongiivirga citrea]NER17182.1 gluconate 2-dehydrogenase subunit 3 family protein [Spongiivirga citrea]
MDRRHALKNIGLGAGFLVATPTILSILEGCKEETPWIPSFMTEEEGTVVSKMVDIILPKTEGLPGAKELNIAQFIDSFHDQVVDEEGQSMFKKGIDGFMKVLGVSGENPAKKLDDKAYTDLFDKYLRLNKDGRKVYDEAIGEAFAAAGEDGEPDLTQDQLAYSFANGIKGMTVWAFHTSEAIGERPEVYLPVPGSYKGCESLEELTGGQAWSL